MHEPWCFVFNKAPVMPRSGRCSCGADKRAALSEEITTLRQQVEASNANVVFWERRYMDACDDWARRCDALTADRERLEVQLAGCMAAALSNTRDTAKQRAKPGDYGFSASYQDVCNAVDREMANRERAEAAEASLAQVRKELENERTINRQDTELMDALEAEYGDIRDGARRVAQVRAAVEQKIAEWKQRADAAKARARTLCDDGHDAWSNGYSNQAAALITCADELADALSTLVQEQE